MPAVWLELEEAYQLRRAGTPSFERRARRVYCATTVGRPSPAVPGPTASPTSTGNAAPACILKREDLNHTGAHKINNSLGQGVAGPYGMGKSRIIAETGAGQHGVATATVAALLNMECSIYMGEVDMERQRPNVVRMNLLGAEVIPVTSGSRTLKDATNETIRDWVSNVRTTHYIIGSTVGPHPYPTIVRDFQAVIGRETREQILSVEDRLPTDVVACVGGGSNALGIYTAFLADEDVRLHGVEAAGSAEGHAAALGAGRPGVLHGALSYLMQDGDGQVEVAHSVAAGLDYPGVGPEHSFLHDSGRVAYGSVSDEEALDAFELLSRCEGIIPALESAHAIAFVKQHLAGGDHDGDVVVINLSGRGDKDVDAVRARRTP